MDRRSFLVGAAASACVLRAGAAKARCLLFSDSELARMRDALDRPGPFAEHARRLRENASAALGAGPWTVTQARPAGLKLDAGPNDYYSEGPYWWPDPKNPGGPYIRKDGERNPERFTGNRNAIGEMSDAVLALGLAAFLLGDSRAGERARLVLDTWFLNTKTRMKPNLEFGQAIRGVNTGRGTGIIDTVSLIYCALGAALAEASGLLETSTAAGVRDWYREYTLWMTTSAKGLDEKKARNNHATWWTAQLAAFSAFTRDSGLRALAWRQYREWLVPNQVLAGGSCPREEARTRSLSYSAMNLDGFSLICRMAAFDGQDLWHYRTPKKVGIEKAFHYLAPFVVDPKQWRKQQITAFDQDRTVFPALAGLGFDSRELLACYRKLPRAGTPWVQAVDLLVQSTAPKT